MWIRLIFLLKHKKERRKDERGKKEKEEREKEENPGSKHAKILSVLCSGCVNVGNSYFILYSFVCVYVF